MKNTKLYLIFGILSISVAVNGQIPSSSNPDAGNMPMDAKVTGKVIDASNSQPVEYSSVGLYRVKDSTLVGGVVTNSTGNFTIDNLPYGKFYAIISFIGYKKQHMEEFLLIPNQKIKNLGEIKLELSSTGIKEVEVVGNSAQMEYKIDKKVVNVSQNVVASGGTAIDALQNVPSIQTDVEGNIQLRGSSSFTVLIDGKPSVIKGSDALQQIPASVIQNIEIITNPSAKYDPDGSAGIINVIMKKEKIKGYNGVINLSAGTGDKYNGSFLLNYRVSKFNFFLGGDFNDMKFKNKNVLNQQSWGTVKDTIDFQLANGEGYMHRKGKTLKSGFDFNINNTNSLTISGTLGNRSFGRETNTLNNIYRTLADGTTPFSQSYYMRDNPFDRTADFYSVNLDYTLKFNDKGHQLLASAYYSHDKDGEVNNLIQREADGTGVIVGTSLYQENTVQDGSEDEFRTKLDYTFPFSEKGKLEAGYQGRYEDSKGIQTFQSKINDADWVKNMDRYDNITFKDHIQSFYSTLSNSMKWFDYQLGLRAEYTDRNITQNVLGKSYPVNRFDFFPTIHLSKQLPWDLQAQASYTRRINRPNGWNLDPMRVYSDPQNAREGNPALLPEFADAYELNLQKKLGEGFISAEGFFRQTNDLITMWNTRENVTNIMLTTFKNLNKDQSAGVEIMLNLPITKWWNINASTSIYNYKLFGSVDSLDISQNTNTWSARANSTFRLNSGTMIQIMSFYNAPTVQAQGTREGFFTTSLGVRQEIFKRKATLTLQVRDLLGQMRFVSTSQGPQFYRYNKMQRESQVFTLTLSYRINNYKQQAKRSQDEINSSDQGGELNGQ